MNERFTHQICLTVLGKLCMKCKYVGNWVSARQTLTTDKVKLVLRCFHSLSYLKKIIISNYLADQICYNLDRTSDVLF